MPVLSLFILSVHPDKNNIPKKLYLVLILCSNPLQSARIVMVWVVWSDKAATLGLTFCPNASDLSNEIPVQKAAEELQNFALFGPVLLLITINCQF
jgi:hypothetical protein